MVHVNLVIMISLECIQIDSVIRGTVLYTCLAFITEKNG